jgi:hypothetical protein
MHYIGSCRCCGQGLLGIRICCEDGMGLVVCEECEAIWLHPTCSGEPLFPRPPGGLCPRCGQSLWSLPAHWASLDEIDRLGWQEYIQGDWDSEV